MNLVIPMKLRTPVLVLGGAISAMAFRLALPGFIPAAETWCPRKVISSQEEMAFRRLKLQAVFLEPFEHSAELVEVVFLSF